MGVRKLFRGHVEWARLETVAIEFARRYNEPTVHVSFINTDNWLSTPCVINDTWFVKIITRRNSIVHSLFTGARNLGAFSSGTEGFFEHFETPYEMAQHDLETTEKMRQLGVNVPEPIEAFEVDGLGVIVMEYLPDYRSLSDLDEHEVLEFAPVFYQSLSTMHNNGVVHGDLRADNVLIHNDSLYFIDATNIRNDLITNARSYDLACAIAVLTPLIGAHPAVQAATEYYSPDELLAAREFLDFVNIRPDHDFDAARVKGEVEKRAVQ